MAIPGQTVSGRGVVAQLAAAVGAAHQTQTTAEAAAAAAYQQPAQPAQEPKQ